MAATADAGGSRLRVIESAVALLGSKHGWAPARHGRVSFLVAGATRAEAAALVDADWTAVAGRLLDPGAEPSDLRVTLSFVGPELYGEAPSAEGIAVGWEPGPAETAVPALLQRLGKDAFDAAFAFMPGFWGYSSWGEGSRALAGLGVPVVCTSYTLQECEDDEDALRG